MIALLIAFATLGADPLVQSPSDIIPQAVREGIERRIQQRYTTRPDLRQAMIAEQIAAYLRLKEYKPSDIASGDLLRIKAAAAKRHPHDYRTQLSTVTDQAEAWRQLRRALRHGIPRALGK